MPSFSRTASLVAAFAAIAALSAPACAATMTVRDGGTGISGDGDISIISGTANDCTGGCPGVWVTDPTTPAPSSWEVLDGVNAATYEFAFDLTGFDASTATLSVQWAADNNGATELNGVALTGSGTSTSSYTTLVSFVVGPAAGLFNDGLNSLRFLITGDNITDGIRASARVEAEQASVVPLPLAAPLLGSGLAALAFAARRRRPEALGPSRSV